jgi:HD-like signal output (HDOD) protein
MELLGITHSELSAAVLEGWKLPAPIIQAVRRHHWEEEGAAGLLPLSAAVSLADCCVNRMGISVLASHPETGRDPAQALTAAGLRSDPRALLDEFSAEFEIAKRYF